MIWHEILVVDIANQVSTVNIIPIVNHHATNEFNNSNTFLEELFQSKNDILELCTSWIIVQKTNYPAPDNNNTITIPRSSCTMILHLKRYHRRGQNIKQTTQWSNKQISWGVKLFRDTKIKLLNISCQPSCISSRFKVTPSEKEVDAIAEVRIEQTALIN